MKDNEILMEIRDRIMKMETHFEDITEKVKYNTRFILTDCPKRHEALTKTIVAMNVKNSFIIGISSAIGASFLSGLIFIAIRKLYGG